MKENYEERNVDFIRMENFSNFSKNGFFIENLVLITKQGNTDSYFDIGSLCYRKRTRTNKVKHYAKVIKSTFNNNVALALKKYLSYKFLKLTVGSSRTILGELKSTVYDLYDMKDQGVDLIFNDIDKCDYIYQFYTKLLIGKVKSGFKDPNFTSTVKYASQQRVCAGLIAAVNDIDKESFRGKYVEILGYVSPNKEKKVFSEYFYSTFLHHCKKTYTTFSEFIFNNNNKFPIVLNIKDDLININRCLYMLPHSTGEQVKYFFNNEGGFLSRIKTVENVKKLIISQS